MSDRRWGLLNNCSGGEWGKGLIDDEPRLEKSKFEILGQKITFDQQHARVINKIIHQWLNRVQCDSFQWIPHEI